MDRVHSPRKNLLVYCILRNEGDVQHVRPAGIDGMPVRLVSDDTLTAVASTIDPACYDFRSPNTADAIAYDRIVRRFHEEYPVLPMRYGSVLEDESRLIALLQGCREEYCRALDDVEGCVEMGLRVLLRDAAGTSATKRRADDPAHRPDPGTAARSPGRAYLEARRADYADHDECAREKANAVERFQRAFAGVYVSFRAECSLLRPPARDRARRPEERHSSEQPRAEEAAEWLLSLYFLVRRDKQDTFREAFQAFSREEPLKALMSGPWPPYNFVPATSGRGLG